MHEQDLDPARPERAGSVLPRRRALKTLAGGAVTGVLVLAGCTPNAAPPTPIVTSTPSPWASPSPAASSGSDRLWQRPTLRSDDAITR
jgi:hypothetical protein